MQKNKDKKLVKNAITIFIVVLMVGSVLGYMFGRDSEESYKYNNYKFTRTDNKFILNINNVDIEFHFFPSDVEYINVSSNILNKLTNKVEIDSTYDEDNKWKEGISVAQYDLERFFNVAGVYFVNGLTAKNAYSMPVIGCNTSTEKTPVIYFKEGNETKIFIDDNCIIAESNDDLGFIRIKDRLIYGLLGVIE